MFVAGDVIKILALTFLSASLLPSALSPHASAAPRLSDVEPGGKVYLVTGGKSGNNSYVGPSLALSCTVTHEEINTHDVAAVAFYMVRPYTQSAHERCGPASCTWQAVTLPERGASHLVYVPSGANAARSVGGGCTSNLRHPLHP